MTPEQAAFWQTFSGKNNVSDGPAAVTAMGDTPAMQDNLAALVVAGTKRATCALARWYGDDGEALPSVGDHWMVINGHDQPVAIVRVTEVSITPISEIDAQFARDEGEGDRSYSWWKAEHDRFWRHEAEREGFVYSDEMDAVCTRFTKVATVAAL
jgi:uncharacterized protein YhfF